MVEKLNSFRNEMAKSEEYPLVAIVGPTASGKSALGLFLAERLNGEIVNYDSVQVYRGFDIGSGKVPAYERRAVPHHLLDILEPGEVFTAGDYRPHGHPVLPEGGDRGNLPVLFGGTGLYLRVCRPGLFEGRPPPRPLRVRLRAMAER